MSRSKAKGTSFESAIVDYLRVRGAPHVERRALAGTADRGDIAGIPGVVIEAKAEAKQDLAGWIGELLAEMVNDGAEIGAVWAKRVGKTSPGSGYIIMPPAVFIRLLALAQLIDDVPEPTDPAATVRERYDKVITLAAAYHYATAPCGPDNCPGVTQCGHAEHLSLAGFRAAYEAMETAA